MHTQCDASLTFPSTPSPMSAAERSAGVDILRGFAIFGILLENMLFFGGRLSQWELDTPWWPGMADRVVVGAIRWLEEGKFYSLFALLFGFGVAAQMPRLRPAG